MGSNNSGKGERVYRRIVVPLDGSEAAEAVLELAKNLAVRSGSALTLLHVCRPEETDLERLHSAYIQRVAELVERDISKICETVQCHFDGVTATSSPVLLNGEPAQEIVRYAEENEASVILMATHGRSGLTHSVMSDIANRVVRNSLVPVWLMRTLGSDDSICAEWPYPEASMEISWDEHLSRIRSHYQAQCSVYLEVVKDRLKEMAPNVTAESLLGNAAEEIIGYIQQNRCDLVAMTTYGHSGMGRRVADSLAGRWIFGNVTEQVLAATSRGILLVRGQAINSEIAT